LAHGIDAIPVTAGVGRSGGTGRVSATHAIPSRAAAWGMLMELRSATSRNAAFSISDSPLVAACSMSQ